MRYEDFAPSWWPSLTPWTTRRFAGPTTLGFSPDGHVLYHVSNADGQLAVWRSAPDGSAARRLTDLGDRAAHWFVVLPDGALIVAADRHGDENHQLYRVSPAGELTPLVVREGVQHHVRARSLSRDGRLLAYSANLRDRANVEVVVRDLRSGEERVVLGGDAWHVVGDWSPDGRFLLASRVDDNTNQDLILVDLRTGETDNLTAHEGEATNVPVGFDESGDGIYLITDRDHDFDWLARLDLRSRTARPVARREWDIAFARLDRYATTLVWCVNEGGYSTLSGCDVRTGRPLGLEPLRPGYLNDLAIADGGQALAVTFTNATTPWSILTLDLNEQRWTAAVKGTIRSQGPLVGEQLVRIPASDGPIPAFIFRPEGGGRHPAVLVLHGGPEGQEHPAYLGLRQFLLACGIGLLVPNIHGSTGYGKPYQRAIHRDWGGIDLRDIEACVTWLRSQEWVDPERLAVFGGSYGGFATLSAISRLPQYWRAAVDAFGPSNLVTMIRNGAPSWRRFHRRWTGDPDTEAERLLAASPITYAHNIRCPLLVIQGTHDARVPRSESDQLVARLRELGREVRYVVQEDVGHGWTSKERLREAYGIIADFLVQHLA